MPTNVVGNLDISTNFRELLVEKENDLSVLVHGGRYEIGSTKGTFVSVVQALTDDATNYLYLSSLGALTVSTSAWPGTLHIRLARVICAGGVIVSVVDERSYFCASSAGGGGSGETNTASNVNTAGTGVFKQKSGVDLEFRGVAAGSSKVSVSLDAPSNEIRLDVAEGQLSLANIGGVLASDAAHGDRAGGSLHANATTSVAGFLSASDKSKLDGVAASATNTPLSTSVPLNVTKSAASAGVSTEASRVDHKHDVSTGSPSSLGTTNAEGSSTALARSDHVHAHAAQTDGTLHAAATTSVAGFLSTSDKTKLDGVASSATNTPLSDTVPVNVTRTAASAGVAVQAARQDHKHDVATSAPTAGIGASNSEGSSTSLARADHNHTLRESGGTDLSLGAVADGQVLQRSGSSLIGVTSSGSAFDPRNVLIFDHFATGNRTSGTTGNYSWRVATGGTGADLDFISENGHPGILRLQLGSAAAGRSALYAGDTSPAGTQWFEIGGANPIEMEVLVKITGSVASADFELLTLGLGLNWQASGSATNCVAVTFRPGSSTAFRLETHDGTTTATSNGTTVVAVNTWYRVGWVISDPGTSPSAQLYVNGAAEGSPITTNFPAGTVGFGLKGDSNGGSTSPLVLIDYVLLTQDCEKED